MTIEIGTGSADLDPIPIIPDIGVTVTVTLAEVTLDPITNPHATAHQATEAQAHTITNRTPHTADPHHVGVSSEITVDLGHTHHKNTITKHQQDCLPALIKQSGKPKDRKYKQVTIDDPPSEYYSSDEQASNSEDDLN